jgi:hypothetical protein
MGDEAAGVEQGDVRQNVGANVFSLVVTLFLVVHVATRQKLAGQRDMDSVSSRTSTSAHSVTTRQASFGGSRPGTDGRES